MGSLSGHFGWELTMIMTKFVPIVAIARCRPVLQFGAASGLQLG